MFVAEVNEESTGWCTVDCKKLPYESLKSGSYQWEQKCGKLGFIIYKSQHSKKKLAMSESFSSLFFTIKKKKSLPSPHQSEHVSQPLGSVINGLHCLAERHSGRTMGILKGHYPYKTPSCCWTIGERLMQSRSTLNIFCVNIRACL